MLAKFMFLIFHNIAIYFYTSRKKKLTYCRYFRIQFLRTYIIRDDDTQDNHYLMKTNVK